MHTSRISLRDCSHETYKLRASLQAIDHIGSGGNAAVVRGFVDEGAPKDVALKLFDPRRINADDREREYRKFEHANLVRIDELTNLRELGFEHVPDWYSNILDCQPEPFVSHPVASCSPNPCNLRAKTGINDSGELRPIFGADRLGHTPKALAEFGPADFFILVMEYCPITLSEHIKHSRSMGEIRRILIEVCAGLTAMHKEGVTHEDLIIENILLTNEGVIKICDFGLSGRQGKGIVGDISNLGLLAFELATGKNLLDYDLMDDDESELNVQGSFVEICQRAVGGSDSDPFCSVNDFLEALNKTF